MPLLLNTWYNKMKQLISFLGILIICCLNTNSFAQNFLNNVYDFQNRSLLNAYTNIYVSNLIYLTEQVNFPNGKSLIFETRNLEGSLLKTDSITSNTLDITTGQGGSLLKLYKSYYTIGSTATFTNFLRSYLVKLDANFDTIFTKSYELTNAVGGSRFLKIISKNNNLYLLRDAQYLDTTLNLYYTKGFITKMDTLGNIIWEHAFGSNNANLQLNDFKLNPDGSFFVFGSKALHQSYKDFFLLKMDALGNILWQSTWGDIYHDGILDLFVMPDGKLLVCGYFSDITNGFDFSRAYLAMLSADGNQIIWQRKFFGLDVFNSFDTDFSHIFKNDDGTYDIWGEEVNYHGDITRPLLMKFSSNFDSLDVQYYSFWNGPGAQNYLRDIVRMPDNGYVACGFGWDDNSNEDGWLLRIDSNGCANVSCTPLAIAPSLGSAKTGVGLYPNPANDIVTIESSEAMNRIEIINAQGQVMETINCNNTLKFSLSTLNYANGIYFYTISHKNNATVRGKFLIQH